MSLSRGRADNASANIRCNVTMILGVSPDTPWETIDKNVYVDEKATEVTEIPPVGYQRDLEGSMMRGGIVMAEVRSLKGTTGTEAVVNERAAKDPRPMATREPKRI